MKKRSSIIMALMMTAVLAAGCGAAATENSSAATTETKDSAESTETAAPANSSAAEALLKEGKESGTLVMKNEQEHTVTVTASGSITVTPDMASITMGVVTDEATAAEAQSKNAETINAVTEKLTELGIEEKSIQTSNYYMSQRYDYESNRVIGYRVETSLTIADQKVEDVGKVISACTENGANQFQGINMTSSEYDAAYEQALADAVNAARRKAEILANAAGMHLGNVASMTEGYQNTSARYRSANYFVESPMEEAASADMKVMPGELSVEAPVTVTYVLTE